MAKVEMIFGRFVVQNVILSYLLSKCDTSLLPRHSMCVHAETAAQWCALDKVDILLFLKRQRLSHLKQMLPVFVDII